MSRQIWEYRTHIIAPPNAHFYENVSHTERTREPAGMSEMLAQFGADGWELASTIVVDEPHSVVLIFKRPKEH